MIVYSFGLLKLDSWYLVDLWGRRAILMSGAIVVRVPASFGLISGFVDSLPSIQMSLALFTIGWWLYVDISQTPQAVVICVIIYNAAFGYRYAAILCLCLPML